MRHKGIDLREIYRYDSEVYGNYIPSIGYLVKFAGLTLLEAKELTLEISYGHKISLEEHQENLLPALKEFLKIVAEEDEKIKKIKTT